MSTLNQTTAKIYQFPVGGRGSLARRQPAVADTGSRNVVTSSSWYHEAAMLEEQAPKPQ
ncbi:DUF2735 domain-containing protein [Rhodopseudomonas palustris]|uniref:DUF2735 domain-containing protein n=1 Tax=Rhodopseudomonas palustris TaxID=1076 RepID=UPI002ACD3656|nr:DUF2735 domain-containing protein [Rhodopseudomonas palustris]WQG99674.1 DUF2735 domain-containing protein [Rhodopseudomonas palustris]